MVSDDVYNDLFGVSPGVIAIIMGLLTLFTPYGVLPMFVTLGGAYISISGDVVYSLFWAFGTYNIQSLFRGFIVYNPLLLWATLPLGLFNVLFAIRVVQYYQDKVSKNSVLGIALIALIIPILLSWFMEYWKYWIVSYEGHFAYYGPIPIQLLAGLYIIYRIRPPDLVTPWVDPEKDESWWIDEELDVFNVGRLFISLEELDEMYKIWD